MPFSEFTEDCAKFIRLLSPLVKSLSTTSATNNIFALAPGAKSPILFHIYSV